MRKLVFLAVTGFAVTALTLATPAESRADHGRGTSVSVSVGSGGFYVDYSRGYSAYPYRSNYYSGGSYYAPIAPGGYIVTPPPVIVRPTEYHWTPYRGWHTHGETLVPHRGHYHVRPY